jgi:hypothetical protein
MTMVAISLIVQFLDHIIFQPSSSEKVKPFAMYLELQVHGIHMHYAHILQMLDGHSSKFYHEVASGWIEEECVNYGGALV